MGRPPGGCVGEGKGDYPRVWGVYACGGKVWCGQARRRTAPGGRDRAGRWHRDEHSDRVGCGRAVRRHAVGAASGFVRSPIPPGPARPVGGPSVAPSIGCMTGHGPPAAPIQHRSSRTSDHPTRFPLGSTMPWVWGRGGSPPRYGYILVGEKRPARHGPSRRPKERYLRALPTFSTYRGRYEGKKVIFWPKNTHGSTGRDGPFATSIRSGGS